MSPATRNMTKYTLDSEYRRDVDKGLPIHVPVNYYLDDDPSKPPLFRWRAHAHLLYENWLNYYVYQNTPYDLGEDPARKARINAQKPVLRQIARYRFLCYTVPAALLHSPNRGKEVNPLETLSTFIQTVAAQVVAYYLCTWIDGKIGKGSKH